MIADTVLRELGAEPRRFNSVRAMLSWWQAEHARRSGTHCAIAVSSPIGVSPSNAAERSATYAKVIACLAPRAPEDLSGDLRLTSRRLANLLAWYDSALDQPSPGRSSSARKTRNQLRRRMLARGLLVA